MCKSARSRLQAKVKRDELVPALALIRYFYNCNPRQLPRRGPHLDTGIRHEQQGSQTRMPTFFLEFLRKHFLRPQFLEYKGLAVIQAIVVPDHSGEIKGRGLRFLLRRLASSSRASLANCSFASSKDFRSASIRGLTSFQETPRLRVRATSFLATFSPCRIGSRPINDCACSKW